MTNDEEENPYAPPGQSIPGNIKVIYPWQYIFNVFRKYAVFKGRARRSEYWWFYLFNVILSVVTVFIDRAFFPEIKVLDRGVFSFADSLAIFLPTWSVTARRMHDTNRSGWYMLIPLYGFILCFFKGTDGPNRYGLDPKEE